MAMLHTVIRLSLIHIYRPVAPNKPGLHVLRNVDLATLVEYIDWGPFFQTWDLAGAYPKILDDAVVGETARSVFADGKAMLEKIIADQHANPWITANAVFGIYPANAVGDDIEIYRDESRKEKLMTWHSLRLSLIHIFQGKGIVNSISMKEGEAAFVQQAKLARRYGAAVIVMAFDEAGQADTYARKTEICKRAYELLLSIGFPPEDIIFDPNIFAIATGIEEHHNYAVDLIEACRWIRANLPVSYTHLDVYKRQSPTASSRRTQMPDCPIRCRLPATTKHRSNWPSKSLIGRSMDS